MSVLHPFSSFYPQGILRILYPFVYQKIHKGFFELLSPKNITPQTKPTYLYLNNFYLLPSWHATPSQLGPEQLACLEALPIEESHFYPSMPQPELKKLQHHGT
jgi:hypothetical protein